MRTALPAGANVKRLRLCDPHASSNNFLAVVNTASSIDSVNRPVFVFCRLGW
jgi:hypothetical protein